MKRKNSTSQNSQILKKNSLFSNKTLMETRTMEIKISKVYMVDGKEYSSREAAFKASAREILEKHYANGVEALIENASEVRRALGILGSKE